MHRNKSFIFIFADNGTCFYGVCLYCNPGDLWCTNSNTLETAVTFYVSSVFPLRLQRHPWSRTYRCNIKSRYNFVNCPLRILCFSRKPINHRTCNPYRWETDADFCLVVKSSKFYSNPRNMEIFLDFMDVAIFDFLISNGDRHRYEYIDRAKIPHILLIDNGKR